MKKEYSGIAIMGMMAFISVGKPAHAENCIAVSQKYWKLLQTEENYRFSPAGKALSSERKAELDKDMDELSRKGQEALVKGVINENGCTFDVTQK